MANRTSARRALITGITGQDGSYLAELLVSKGYEVYGVIRRSSSFNTGRIDAIYRDPHMSDARLRLVYGDLNDGSSLRKILNTIKPDEIYNLAAQSHVRTSFEIPEYTADVTAVGALRLLEAIRESGLRPRLYQASSSEMFGKAVEVPQREGTPFYPRSPYAAAKVYAYWIAVNYREAYDLFICNGILFNHESPRRGETFVSRKITKAVARIKLGIQPELYLGNLEARRDWGFAGDYVQAMWLMLQQETPDDYVIATGENHSVRELLDLAFGHLDLEWQDYVKIGRRHLRNLRSLDVNALGIVDVDRARSIAAARGCDATVYATLEEALASAPDFALIATPTHLHLRPALACARAGVHVLIEKPLAATGGEISALVGEVAARRLHAMVACNLRFDDVYMRVQRALDEVALGRVYAAQFYFGYDLSAWRPGVDYRNVYSAWRDQGGGITLDGIHELDLALYWFGQPRRILSLPRRTGMLAGDAEDVLDLIVEFRTGVVASLHLNYLDPVYRRTVSVAGDQAVVEGDFARRQVAVRGRHAVVTTDNFPDDRNAMYVRQLEYFLGVVRGEARQPAA